jgi:tetratricopeptide (TPR) repeat protein/tRNA A-37 threonylcarbamoyl transferase component Bud32
MERPANHELGDAEGAAAADALRPADVLTQAPEDEVDDEVDEPAAADELDGSAVAESGVPHWRRALVRSRVFPRLDMAPRIGRYRVLNKLGRGGMGTVVAAHDETLDRRVALKLLHDDLASKPRQRHRLMREAQAMARVSHPNVVTVYEADVFEDQLYIAMELVEGLTLDAWQRKALRSWQDCFAAYVQAGRGLEAAHAQMLVHRDFKPGNCIIDTQARVRVLDFGLARDTTHGPVPSELTAASNSSVLSTSITVTGAMIGTVAYMSPEQLQGKPADARSDQFSFCVSMYEALYGQRPFVAETAGELLAAILQQRFGALPKSRRVPSWLRRLLRRGLALHPADRHPSMTELLARLEAVPRRRRRMTLGSLGLGLVASVGVASAMLAGPADSPCAELRGRPPAAWDEATRDATEQAIMDTELPDAPAVWAGVSSHLDAYAQAWSAARFSVCEAGGIDPRTLPPAPMAQLACLEDRVRVLEALTGRLVVADRRTAAHAVSAAEALPSVAECQESLVVRERPEVPDGLQPRVDDVLERTARVFVLERLGRFEEGLLLAEGTLAAARELATHYEPPLAEVLLAQGRLMRRSLRYAPAEEALMEAARVAERNQDDRCVEDVLHELVLMTIEQQRVPEGRVWLSQAHGKAERMGERIERDLLLLHDEARLARASGDLSLAAERLRGAIDGFRKLPHAGSRLNTALTTLALVREAQERPDEALSLYQEALAGHQRQGDLHGAGEVTYDIAGFYLTHGRLPEAVETYEHALALFAASHGERSPILGSAHYGMASALFHQGELEQALAQATAAESLLRDGGSIADRVWALVLVANIHQVQQRPAQALESFLRAEELTADGVDDETRATVLGGVGDSLMVLGRLTEAEPRLVRALELLEAGEGGERSLAFAYALMSVARLRDAQGRLLEAKAAYERGWTLQQRHDDRSLKASVAWALAGFYWKLADIPQVREHAATAREIYVEQGAVETVKEIDALLRKCGSKCQ